MSNQPEHSPLGKTSAYKMEYDPRLLFPIPRQGKRNKIGLAAGTPLLFPGVNPQNLYELSWPNLHGKPQMALGIVIIPADSPSIAESKLFKLYLSSFNQTKVALREALQQLIHHDLLEVRSAPVQVRIAMQEEFARQKMGELDGLLLDCLDTETDVYQPTPELLHADEGESPVEEALVLYLLKSGRLVTGQPDWGNVRIHYVGAPTNQEALLKYLISLREHNEFHEQRVERIFTDIPCQCRPIKLAVYARYIHCGRLNINPSRTNYNTPQPDNLRSARR